MTDAERLAKRLRELLAKAHLPWRVQKETLPNRVGVTAANHEFITWAMGSGWKADLIVEAVNALPTLLARIDALEEALRVLLDASERHIFGDECLAERVAARLALGKGSE